eukprot:11154258-Alexandrium_andersonii.AAC.1
MAKHVSSARLLDPPDPHRSPTLPSTARTAQCATHQPPARQFPYGAQRNKQTACWRVPLSCPGSPSGVAPWLWEGIAM